jgi:hypothetical protein
MAASGYTPIQLYYSTTATNQPTSGNLLDGELAINITDGKLYYKDNTGTVKLLASNTSTVNVNTISFGSTGLTPATATSGAVTVAGTLGTANGGTGSTSTTYCSLTTNVTGTLPVGNGGTGITSLTANYIPYGNGSSAFQSSANLTFNGSTLAITGALTATADSAFTSTGALQLPSGTTGQQPTGVAGKLRFNTTSSSFEGYNGSAWTTVGGASITNDTSTATAVYPLFAATTSGSATTVYTSNANLLYTPSTGALQAKELEASNGLIVNNATINSNYSIPAGYNASSVGPVTVIGAITVPSGSRWLVL